MGLRKPRAQCRATAAGREGVLNSFWRCSGFQGGGCLVDYVKPELHFVPNSGGLSGGEIARLSDGELAAYPNERNIGEAKQCYRIDPGYVLRQIGGEAAIVPVDAACTIQNAVMTPNGPAAFLWTLFQTPVTEEDAVQQGLQRYEGPEDVIRNDVRRFIRESLRLGILKEVM